MQRPNTSPPPSVPQKAPAEQVVKDIRHSNLKLHSAEEKIRVVLDGLRGRQHR